MEGRAATQPYIFKYFIKKSMTLKQLSEQYILLYLVKYKTALCILEKDKLCVE